MKGLPVAIGEGDLHDPDPFLVATLCPSFPSSLRCVCAGLLAALRSGHGEGIGMV